MPAAGGSEIRRDGVGVGTSQPRNFQRHFFLWCAPHGHLTLATCAATELSRATHNHPQQWRLGVSVSCFRSATKRRRRGQQHRARRSRAGCRWQTDLSLDPAAPARATRTRCLPPRRVDTGGWPGRVHRCRLRLTYRCACVGVVKRFGRGNYLRVCVCWRLVDLQTAGGRHVAGVPSQGCMESRHMFTHHPCPQFLTLLKPCSPTVDTFAPQRVK